MHPHNITGTYVLVDDQCFCMDGIEVLEGREAAYWISWWGCNGEDEIGWERKGSTYR